MNFTLPLPPEFSFDLCFSFLKRSPKELLHRCSESSVRKLVNVDGKNFLLELSPGNNELEVHILNSSVTHFQEEYLRQYIIEWFDLETDLRPFYELAEKDKLLKDLVSEILRLPNRWPTRFVRIAGLGRAGSANQCTICLHPQTSICRAIWGKVRFRWATLFSFSETRSGGSSF